MTKQDLVNQVADATGIAQTAVQLIIDDATDAIQQALAEGDTVTLRGFGSFLPCWTPDRQARNLVSGEPVFVPAHYTPKFKPSQEFKQKVSHLGKTVQPGSPRLSM